MSEVTIRKTGLLLTTSSTNLTFDEEHLIVYRTPPFTKTQAYITNLVRKAQDVAFRSCTANVLVGHSDEGSDMGDVGLWLGPGDYGKGNEKKILQTLELPESLITTSHEKPELLKELRLEATKDGYCFSVQTGSYVYFFYIDQFEDGWGGLVAVGVWT